MSVRRPKRPKAQGAKNFKYTTLQPGIATKYCKKLKLRNSHPRPDFTSVNANLDASNKIKVGKPHGIPENQPRDCKIVTSVPPMLTVAERVIVGFTVARKVTAPLPEKVAVLAGFTQLALLFAR